ncbi:MAG: helical backbone metal receptor [Desulfobulbus sp.]|jgi:iron complex transport system substrate-binding protein|nr:helical backbone metal receptor [Desulfobulbus sp.]
MRCPVFPFPRPAGRTLAAVVSLLLCAVLWTLPAGATGTQEVPMRIVSLSPLLTENVFLLGAGERMVGNTSYCTKPEAAKAVAKVGSVMELSIERIIGLRPDLVLAINLSPPQQVAQLERLGLRVRTFHQPESFAEMCDQFLELGALLGREQRAREIVDEATRRAEAVRRATADLPRRKVFLQVGANPLFSSVQDSFTHEYMVLGGGENIAGDRRSGAMTTEQVLALDPEVIIIAVMGSEDGIGGGEKGKWERYRAMRAVRDGRVHVLDPDQVCSPSPLTFAASLEAIARLIHPDLDFPAPAP